MRVVRVNTTAYFEEDFFLLTDLEDDEIVEVVTPIVLAERDGGRDYDNEFLLDALKKRFPYKKMQLYTEFDIITI